MQYCTVVVFLVVQPILIDPQCVHTVVCWFASLLWLIFWFIIPIQLHHLLFYKSFGLGLQYCRVFGYGCGYVIVPTDRYNTPIPFPVSYICSAPAPIHLRVLVPVPVLVLILHSIVYAYFYCMSCFVYIYYSIPCFTVNTSFLVSTWPFFVLPVNSIFTIWWIQYCYMYCTTAVCTIV